MDWFNDLLHCTHIHLWCKLYVFSFNSVVFQLNCRFLPMSMRSVSSCIVYSFLTWYCTAQRHLYKLNCFLLTLWYLCLFYVGDAYYAGYNTRCKLRLPLSLFCASLQSSFQMNDQCVLLNSNYVQGYVIATFKAFQTCLEVLFVFFGRFVPLWLRFMDRFFGFISDVVNC